MDLNSIPAESVVPTKYWHVLDDGRVQCDVCPRLCKLREGQRGLCYIRACHGGSIVLTSYGRSSGFCVDPIEKKPLNHFLPGTPVLSFGTAGCNLACRFCQNWDISKARQYDVLADQATGEMIAAAANHYDCRSVAFTYNDPVVFLEYARDVAEACHRSGLSTVAVTAGYINPEPRTEFFGFIDAANVDLKAFNEDFYRRVCGGRLDAVLDTLEYVAHETEVWLEITTLLIPGLNDSNDEIDRLTRWVCKQLGPDVPLHFTAFHPDFKMLDRAPTPIRTLQAARSLAIANGLRHVYTGNVLDLEGQSTFCFGCGEVLIERVGYEVAAWGLDADGRCQRCGETCPGVLEERPGDWGSQRLPVRLGS